ncbi:MAG: hypothetical protein QM734_07955 [Cyclobacteriaceae bacterium]
MKLRQREIEINCPYCHRSIEADGVERLECPLCRTIINFNAEGKVSDYKVPEYHDKTVAILAVVSFILFAILMIDAALSKNSNEKLTVIGLIVVVAVLMFLWLPIRYGYSYAYSRFPNMIALTALLLLFLILHVGDFINY